MCKRIAQFMFAAGLAAAISIPVVAQTPNEAGTSQAGKPKGHMSSADSMMTMDQKAAAFDRMSEKQRMAAMKMGGHDMAKMSTADRTSAWDKLTPQEKADMYDHSHKGKSKMMNDGKMNEKMPHDPNHPKQ